ncbi:hypothetical protein [Hydrogenophaga sp.]|uniref:hypothetical protein n=1 Tax=Hydrogenophaga sp. TaxID=1904254 RepID=UPI00286E33E6|nr:hypothetical protein [Hydrogenophaga sp.]
MNVDVKVKKMESVQNETESSKKGLASGSKVYEVQSGDYLYRAAQDISRMGLALYIQNNPPSAPLQSSIAAGAFKASRVFRVGPSRKRG